MKAAETRTAIISVLGRRIETVKLPSDPDTLRSNYQALEAFLAQVDVPAHRHEDTRRGYHWWQGVPKSAIADLLDKFKAHSTDELFSQAAISKFVRNNGTVRFRTWDVVLVNGPKTAAPDEIGVVEFIPPSRTFIKGGQGHELRLGGKSSRLAGADDLTNVLSKEVVDTVRAEYAGENIPEDVYYRHLERPALLIYALRPAGGKAGEGTSGEAKSTAQEAAKIIEDAGVLVVALKLAFPGDTLRDDSGDVQYVINAVAQRTWFPDIEDVPDEDVDA